MKTYVVKWNFIKAGGPQHWTGFYEETFGPHNNGVIVKAETAPDAIKAFCETRNLNPGFLTAIEETD